MEASIAKSVKDKKTNLHFRRFELKYHVPRAIADRIIPQMMNYMVWDDYTQDDAGYDVHTLYMDSPGFKCYHEKLDGIMNRKKVRIRTYVRDYNDRTSMFLELKRRSGEVILKDRMIVKGADFKDFMKDPFSLMKTEAYRGGFLNEFLWEHSVNTMKPVVLVSYKRKAFFSRFDSKFRVTFDYDISFAKPDGLKYNTNYENFFDDLVVMEVKFNGAMPRWFHDIIEEYGLTKDTFSKYCSGIESMYGLPAYF
ncbi:polyphosphate polymerase domain-containing protein [Candidatus Peregrinibacteria bacterium]|jgi:SPX domain protein involved in polyphosphate accumulation|nr:polyphosphate polymerase domain-containing protein [Candidatus Peregrinibacteria bacterium]MBT4056154.1 polyphosphate polymerase domain-containing protein [Candidatus Peregrinibacteria bacterium]